MNDEGGPSVLYLEACFGATMAATSPPAAAAMLINSKATFPAALLSSQLDSLQRYKAPPVNERTRTRTTTTTAAKAERASCRSFVGARVMRGTQYANFRKTSPFKQ